MIQDLNIQLQLDRLDMGMDRATAMLEALCEAEGIDSFSSLMEEGHTMSPPLLLDVPSSEKVHSLDT